MLFFLLLIFATKLITKDLTLISDLIIYQTGAAVAGVVTPRLSCTDLQGCPLVSV